MLRYKKLDLV